MKAHLVPTLYLCTSMIGLYWAGYYTLLGMYGIKLSVRIVVIFLGALLLGAGAFMQWALPRKWTLSLLIVGSSAVAAYWIVPSLRNLLNDLPAYIFLCVLIICVGGILSGTGEMLQSVFPRTWHQLIPIVGSSLMGSFFVTAIATAILYDPSQVIPAFDPLPSLDDLLFIFTVVFVVSSLVFALRAGVRALQLKRLSDSMSVAGGE